MKKIVKIGLLLLAFLTILSMILIKPLNDLDEIWNYNFARNVHDGLVPYKDFNMLQMPLLPLVCGAILRIIANELILMRILAAILSILIVAIIYNIFRILKIKNNISLIITFLTSLLLINYFCIDYNWVSLYITLILIYEELKECEKDKIVLYKHTKKNLIIGLLAGLTFTLKQTSGICICLIALLNKLFFVRNKKDLCIYLKTFLCRLIGILIPILAMLIYLIANGAMQDFISYTIKGVSSFSNYIPYINLLKLDIVGILAILVPIYVVYGIYIVIRKKDINLYYLLIYGLGIFIIVFPISDNIHFLIGATPIIIAMFYEVAKILNKIKIEKTILNYIYILGLIYLISATVVNLYVYIANYDNYSKLKHYSYIIIDDDFEKEIMKISQYINASKKDVKVLDASAAIYMIPIDRYNKNYDLLLKGNLGENGDKKIIEEIKKAKNTQYLIKKDEEMLNWQTPLNIISYVKKSKNKVSEIGRFDIYE